MSGRRKEGFEKMSEEEKKKVSKAQQKAVNKYVKDHYDSINLRLPQGYKQKIQDAAKVKGESINGFIKAAIDQRLDG